MRATRVGEVTLAYEDSGGEGPAVRLRPRARRLGVLLAGRSSPACRGTRLPRRSPTTSAERAAASKPDGPVFGRAMGPGRCRRCSTRSGSSGWRSSATRSAAWSPSTRRCALGERVQGAGAVRRRASRGVREPRARCSSERVGAGAGGPHGRDRRGGRRRPGSVERCRDERPRACTA